MDKRKLHLLGQCIVNRTLGKDVHVEITGDKQVSAVRIVGNTITNENRATKFWFGCFNEQEQRNQLWFQIIVKRFPIAATVQPALFAMLHEVGHVYAPTSITKDYSTLRGMSSLEYRNLPDEAFADKWAADFIKKNKMIVQIWNKQIREAL